MQGFQLIIILSQSIQKSVSNFKRFLIQNNMDKSKILFKWFLFCTGQEQKNIWIDFINYTNRFNKHNFICLPTSSDCHFLVWKKILFVYSISFRKSFYERYSLYLSINVSLYLSVIIFYALYSKRILESFEIGLLILGIDLIFTIFTLKKKNMLNV